MLSICAWAAGRKVAPSRPTSREHSLRREDDYNQKEDLRSP